MQAVILCAGKGTRMGDLSKEIPKPLIKFGGKSLLEYKLEALPEIIDEVILVIGHLGNKIREEVGEKYGNKKVTYIEDKLLTGTAHALWQCKDVLKDKFLVMMGDDIYKKDAIEGCLKEDLAIACIKADRETTGSRVLLRESGQPADFVTHKMYLTLREDGGLIFTGLYMLTREIFDYEPVKLDTKDEWGLPQTLLRLAQDKEVNIVETNFWLPVGTPEELLRAEEMLK